MSDSKTPAQRSVSRFLGKEAMSVIIRAVASHNWGWFSREDERMHIQTVDSKSLTGQNKVKFWLENRGSRVCTLAEGKMSATDQKKIQAKVSAERAYIETQWIHFIHTGADTPAGPSVGPGRKRVSFPLKTIFPLNYYTGV